MRKTLRRSCDACAKSKLACDLRTPQCSRCVKRKSTCVYANQPLSLSPTETTAVTYNNPGVQHFDPFESYPTVRLPRAYVQRLIQHFLSTIAFQYYPLDLNGETNPFCVSWWPLALADPALFHVSLQTASLDLELRAQQGFTNSETLMSDSVSLVRQKIEDSVLAFQDETLDAVVTLAAIEYGKGNIVVSKVHIDGVKRMVQMRGGIQQVKLTSPLTARMVPWVCMVVTQLPQFPAQDDQGEGHGVSPIPQWYATATTSRDTTSTPLANLDLDPEVGEILSRLRFLLNDPRCLALSTTDLHDLTCFVLHRLIRPPQTNNDIGSYGRAISECIRHATVLYMLVVHGPAYFSHAQLQYITTEQLKSYLERLPSSLLPNDGSLVLWFYSVGMVASDGTPSCMWFMSQARKAAEELGIFSWELILLRLKNILWLDTEKAEIVFQRKWDEVWAAMT